MPVLDRNQWVRVFGESQIQVSAICMGGAQLGSMPEVYGYSVDKQDAVDLVRSVFDSPIHFIDTSNMYADGESEIRIGEAIRRNGGLPADFVLSTKVDAKDGDYSGQRVRDSIRESKDRLGLDHLPIVFLHDPEFHDFDELTARGGAVDTLIDLQRKGEIGLVGVAGGDTRVISRYLDLGVFQTVIIHSRWTLVDRSADAIFARACREGITIINAAVYGGGLLTSSRPGTRYAYRPARPVMIRAAEQMRELCQQWNTTIEVAALQFSLRDPRITSTVTGFTRRETMGATLSALEVDLSDQFWDEIESLVPAASEWLDRES
jgi:D-threo-aldose 1-dehydrogenase